MPTYFENDQSLKTTYHKISDFYGGNIVPNESIH